MEAQLTLAIPNDQVGVLIGKGGDTIKDIAMKSGAKIMISKVSNPDGTRDVLIQGGET